MASRRPASPHPRGAKQPVGSPASLSKRESSGGAGKSQRKTETTSRAPSHDKAPSRDKNGTSRKRTDGHSGASEYVSSAMSAAGRPTRQVWLRGIILFIVCAVAFIVLFPTIRTAIEQQNALSQQQAQLAEAKARNEELQAELDRWKDPAFVKAQAREHLLFVMPGEKRYRVLDPDSVQEPTEKKGAEAVAKNASSGVWYRTMWESIETAGESEPTASPRPTPSATKSTASPTP